MSGLCGPLPPDPMAVPLCFPRVAPPASSRVLIPLPWDLWSSNPHHLPSALRRWDLGRPLQALSGFSSTLEGKVRVTRHRAALSLFPFFLKAALLTASYPKRHLPQEEGKWAKMPLPHGVSLCGDLDQTARHVVESGMWLSALSAEFLGTGERAGGKEAHCLSPSPRVPLRWGPPASQISWVTSGG